MVGCTCEVGGGTWVVGGGLGGGSGCTVPLCTWSLAPSVGRNDSLVLSRCRRLRRYSRPLSVTTLYDLGTAGPITNAHSGHLSIRWSMSFMQTTSCGWRGERLFPPLMSIGGLVTVSRQYWRQGNLVSSFRPNISSTGVLPLSSELFLYASKIKTFEDHFLHDSYSILSQSIWLWIWGGLEVSGMNPHPAAKLLNFALANCVPFSDITSGIPYLANRVVMSNGTVTSLWR